jgi:hypothetical protein
MNENFKVGDKRQITWYPSKRGAAGGALATLTLPNGREFGDSEFGRGGGRVGGPGDSQAENVQFPSAAEGAK